jgi:peptide/nickel transport system ATP-binding protein
MSTDFALKIEDLTVKTHLGKSLLSEFSCTLPLGQCLFVVGESGAGKSLLAQAVLGNLSNQLEASGTISIGGKTSPAAQPSARRALWGKQVSMLPQEPTLALDPLRTMMSQLADVFRWVKNEPKRTAYESAQKQLALMGLSEASNQRSWQLSGGMAQRAALAICNAAAPRLLVLDEPTKGVDDRWQRFFIEQMLVQLKNNQALLVITHDLNLIEQFEKLATVSGVPRSQLIVLKDAHVIERGESSIVITSPQAPFTVQLIDAQTKNWAPLFANTQKLPNTALPVLALNKIAHRFSAPKKSAASNANYLFQNLNLELFQGERLSVVGPSGTGKSTLGNIMLGLLEPLGGKVQRHYKQKHLYQKLYQNPAQSFPSAVSLERSLLDLCALHQLEWTSVCQKLESIGIDLAMLKRPATQVSGGELQRISLVRVMSLKPVFLFADEPTSRLDVLNQRNTMTKIAEWVLQNATTTVLVTHDKHLAENFATNQLRLGSE